MWEGLVAALLALRHWGGRALPLLAYERLDRIEAAGRERFGAWTWSAVAATALFGLSALVARPALHSVALGRHYAALAANPFSADPNPVGLRLATPFLSHCFGLRGEALLFTNLILAWFLLLFVHRHFVCRGTRAGDALAAAAAVALSLVTLAPLYFGGYCDSLTYLALFGAWTARRHPERVAACAAVGLVNHEAFAFVLPWVVWESWGAIPSRTARLRLLLGLAASLATYAVYRDAASGLRPVEFSLAYYLAPLVEDPLHWARRSAPYWLLGLFTVFRLLWWVPAWHARAAWRHGDRHSLVGLALLFGGPAASLFVAFDTSRLWTLAFPSLLVGIARTPGDVSPSWREAFLGILLANFLVPPLFTAERQVVLLHSPLGYALLSLLGLPK